MDHTDWILDGEDTTEMPETDDIAYSFKYTEEELRLSREKSKKLLKQAEEYLVEHNMM